MIERVLEEEDVPLELFHLAQAESGFRTKARSYARATGMWQFMSFRGKQYGLRQDRYLEERYDPEKAARAAAPAPEGSLHRIRRLVSGDGRLQRRAKSGDPGRLRAAAHATTGSCAGVGCFPAQTRNYVPIILAMTYVDKNLDMYDVGTVDYAPARRYDTVYIEQEATLELLADIAGTRASELEDLNPALARSATPPYRYALRVPVGSGETLLAELEKVPADKRMQWRRHQVHEGETLADVAKRWKIKPSALAGANNLSLDDDPLSAGLALNVPVATKLRSFRSYGGAGGLVDDGTGRYRIANGDTLGGIARRFGVSVAQLRSWNGLPNTFIRAGRYLIVRPQGASSGSSSSSSSTRAAASAGPAPEGRYRRPLGRHTRQDRPATRNKRLAADGVERPAFHSHPCRSDVEGSRLELDDGRAPHRPHRRAAASTAFARATTWHRSRSGSASPSRIFSLGTVSGPPGSAPAPTCVCDRPRAPGPGHRARAPARQPSTASARATTWPSSRAATA